MDHTAPLRLEPRRSIVLAVSLITLHGGALVWLALTPWAWWIKIIVAVGIAASLVDTFRTHAAQRGKRAIVSLIGHSDGRWSLRMATGEEYIACLLPCAYVHPRLVILQFRAEGSRWRRYTLVLLRGAVDTNTFRRLRVRLNLHADADSPATGDTSFR